MDRIDYPQEESFVPSGKWILTMFALGLFAAILGGLTCAAIAPGSRAPVALAVVVAVLGLLTASESFMAPDEGQPTVRDADIDKFEAMMHARTPPWVALLNPVFGVVGVLIGARLRGGAKD